MTRLAPWISVRNPESASTASDNSGKWILAFPADEAVRVWPQIEAATAAGTLGSAAKIATNCNPAAADPGSRICCIYVADYRDVDEVKRVARAIRALGLIRRQSPLSEGGAREGMNFKCDSATFAREYGPGTWTYYFEAKTGRLSKNEARREAAAIQMPADIGSVRDMTERQADLLSRRCDVTSLEQLATQDPEELGRVMRRGPGGLKKVTTDKARIWVHHAESLRTQRPVLFGESSFKPRAFICLDLEYDPCGGEGVWLAGAVRVGWRTKKEDWLQTFAAPRAQGQLLRELSAFLERHPTIPVVTYGGTGADLPHLKKACARWKMKRLYNDVCARHVDLLTYIRRSLCLPCETLRQSAVASTLGFPVPDLPIQNGREALRIRAEYIEMFGTSEAEKLREMLLEYNRSDLLQLIHVTRRVRDLAAGSHVTVRRKRTRSTKSTRRASRLPRSCPELATS